MIQNFILLLTLVVIVFYTYETHRLRKQSEEQTREIIKQKELSVRPFLRLTYVNYQEEIPLLGRKLLVLSNEGAGPAIDIRINVLNKVSGHIKNSEVTFLNIPVIRQGDTCNIWDSYLTIEPMQSTWTPMHYISPKEDVFNEYELEIQYTDILNQRYVAVIKTDKNYTDSFQIVEQRKML